MWNNNPIIVTENYLNKIILSASNDFLQLDDPKIRKLNGDHKLSNVYILNDAYIMKIVTKRHVEYHRLLTLFWNASLQYIGCDNFFESFECPYDMVEHEYTTMEDMRDVMSVYSPKPIAYADYADCGVIISEYISDSEPFGNTHGNTAVELTEKLFNSVSNLHSANIPHGDLQQDNILVSENNVYIIDANHINKCEPNYKYYDIASVISTASRVIGAEKSIELAKKYFANEDIKKCKKFIDIIVIQFGHDANKKVIKSEIDAI